MIISTQDYETGCPNVFNSQDVKYEVKMGKCIKMSNMKQTNWSVEAFCSAVISYGKTMVEDHGQSSHSQTCNFTAYEMVISKMGTRSGTNQ